MSDHPDFLQAILAAPDDDAPRLVYCDWLEENAVTAPCRECGGKGELFVNVAEGGVYLYDCRGTPVYGSGYKPCGACHGTGRTPDGRAERAEFIRVQCELARLGADTPLEQQRREWITNKTIAVAAPTAVEVHKRALARIDDLRRRERELTGAPVCRHCEWHEPIPHGGWSWEFRRGFVESLTTTAAEFLRHAAAVFAAQPIRVVTLTTWPAEEVAADNLEERWPGVRFHLPS